MLKFMKSIPWSRGLVVALLSSFILSVTYLGQPLGLSESVQEDKDDIENDLETAEMLIASPVFMLEPADIYIADAEFLSRSADMVLKPVDVDDTDDFAPAGIADDIDLAGIADDIVPTGNPDVLVPAGILEDFVPAGIPDELTLADMYVDAYYVGDEILYGVESVLVAEEPEVLVFGAVEYTVYISASRLNLRAGPSTDSDVVEKLKMGDKVVCVGENEEWLQVIHDDQVGYLKIEYTSRSMVFVPVSETMYVAAEKLNLRAGPSTSKEVLTVLKTNDKLSRTGVGDGWSLVKSASGTVGYVSTIHLTDKAPVVPVVVKETAVTTSKDTSTTTTTTKSTSTATAAPKTNSSESELELFTKIVALEGDSKYGYEGYLAVASIILNRVKSSRFPNTITKVVSQPGQFSVYTSTRTPNINDSVRKAVKDVLAGKRNMPGYVLFFATPSAYERNAANGGVFGTLSVYTISLGHVWCYYPADR